MTPGISNLTRALSSPQHRTVPSVRSAQVESAPAASALAFSGQVAGGHAEGPSDGASDGGAVSVGGPLAASEPPPPPASSGPVMPDPPLPRLPPEPSVAPLLPPPPLPPPARSSAAPSATGATVDR